MSVIKESGRLIQVSDPVVITPWLLPGVWIGNGFVSITYNQLARTPSERTRYEYFIDTGIEWMTSNDLCSGLGGGTLQEGLKSLLSFLSESANRYRHAMRYEREHKYDDFMFSLAIVQWAYRYEDEIGMLAVELDIKKGLIIETQS